jgi:hypothetical protein
VLATAYNNQIVHPRSLPKVQFSRETKSIQTERIKTTRTAKTALTMLGSNGFPLGIDAAVGSRDIPESTVERR